MSKVSDNPLKKTYSAVGVKINIVTGENGIIELLDEYFDPDIANYRCPGAIDVTLYYQKVTPAKLHSARKNGLFLYKGSIIDAKRRIIYSQCPRLPRAGQAAILLDPLWQMLLHLGYYPLHGALIRSGRHLIAVFGPSRSGKSTIASASLKYGFSLCCDDFFFVRDNGKDIEILPFAKKVKVRNIQRKTFLDPERIGITSRKSRLSVKNIIVVFPGYSSQKNACLCGIPRKSGIFKVIEENLMLENKRINKEMSAEMLSLIFRLGEKTNFYELIYHDYNISGGIFQKLLNTKNIP
jgi:hypothetical protein